MFTVQTSFNSPILNEAQTLAERGHLVTILAPEKDNRSQRQVLPENVHFRWINLATRRLPRGIIFWAIKYAEALLRAILAGLRETADLYEAHDVDALLPAWIVARLKRKKLLLNAHELWTERPQVPARPLWRWLERKLIPAADAVICPEENRAQILYQEYGARTFPAVVANCGLYRPIDRTTRLSDFLAAQGVTRARIVLYQGGLSASRCCEELIEAFALVSSGAVLVLMGRGAESYVKRLHLRIADHKLGRKVFLHSHVPLEEVMAYTASADIGVALYRNTGRNNYYCAPTKLDEYLMAGLPVIVSDFPGMRKLVGDNKIGLLVDPESPRLIAQAIDRLVSDSKLYASISRQGNWFVENVYNWQNESQKLMGVYNDLLATREKDRDGREPL
jgi:glycosyltransferase involved in cell wall biosynthesis